MSLATRKTDFCLFENKGADQLGSNTAQLISAFVFATHKVQFLFFINPKFQVSSLSRQCTGRFVSDLVRNPEDLFFRVAAQMGILIMTIETIWLQLLSSSVKVVTLTLNLPMLILWSLCLKDLWCRALHGSVNTKMSLV